MIITSSEAHEISEQNIDLDSRKFNQAMARISEKIKEAARNGRFNTEISVSDLENLLPLDTKRVISCLRNNDFEVFELEGSSSMHPIITVNW